MARGRPRGEHGGDPRTNKMEAVRQAMASLGFEASPVEIQQFVKEKFDQDMSPNMISSYKSSLRSKAGMGRKRRRGRPAKTETSAAPATPFHDGVPWKDIRAIKDIVGRIGVKGLRELVELLD